MKIGSFISAHAKYMASVKERRFLQFKIQGITYVIDLLNIKSVRPYELPSPGLRLAPIFCGVIKVGVGSIPVVDFRQPMHNNHHMQEDSSGLIFLEENDTTVALAVDVIDEIVALDEASLQPLEVLNTRINNAYVQAIRGKNGQGLILLDAKAMLRKSLAQ